MGIFRGVETFSTRSLGGAGYNQVVCNQCLRETLLSESSFSQGWGYLFGRICTFALRIFRRSCHGDRVGHSNLHCLLGAERFPIIRLLASLSLCLVPHRILADRPPALRHPYARDSRHPFVGVVGAPPHQLVLGLLARNLGRLVTRVVFKRCSSRTVERRTLTIAWSRQRICCSRDQRFALTDCHGGCGSNERC